MKLRILGDSIRLRLSQSDVQTLLAQGRVEEQTHFTPDTVLRYVAELAGDVDDLQAQLSGAQVAVRIPEALARRWGESDEVTLAAQQSVGDDRALSLLVEKDFKCAVPRAGEEDYDGFPHPDVSC